MAHPDTTLWFPLARLGAWAALAAAMVAGCESSSSSGERQIDCSNVGCALPPMCGQGCNAPCGCCPCVPGMTMTSGGKTLTCIGGCFDEVTDGGVTDAGTDGPIDCSNVGCGPPPICGSPCGSACGCCGCAPGETFTDGGVTYECQGSCYAATAACPPSPPPSLSACAGSTTCTYMDCAGPGIVTASCGSGTWSVSATPCATVFCGGSQCGAGTLCVERVSGAYLAECDLNPCGTGPITCDCAASLCAGAECSASGTTVTCNSCPSGLCP